MASLSQDISSKLSNLFLREALIAGISAEDLNKLFELTLERFDKEMRKPENSKDPLVKALLEFKRTLNPTEIILEVSRIESSKGEEQLCRYFTQRANNDPQEFLEKAIKTLATDPNNVPAINEIMELLKGDLILPYANKAITGNLKIELERQDLKPVELYTAYFAYDQDIEGQVLNDSYVKDLNTKIASGKKSLQQALQERIANPVLTPSVGKGGTNLDEPVVKLSSPDRTRN